MAPRRRPCADNPTHVTHGVADGAMQTLLGVMNVDATVFAICVLAVLVGAFEKG